MLMKNYNVNTDKLIEEQIKQVKMKLTEDA